MRSDSHLIWLCVSCWFPWLRHSVFHIFGWSRWKNRTPQIPAAIPWESYTWVSARWFSASPCCTISELCGVGSLSPRRLAQRSVHPGNLLTVARTIPWPVAVLRPYSSACAPTTRRVSCAWGSCNTIRWAECSASGRTLGGRDTRQHLSWRFYSSAFSFRCFCREQARFAGDKAKCAFRYGIRCGNHCDSSGSDRALEFLQSFLPKGLCLQFFLHFGFSLFVKWNPKNHYFIFLFPAFFLIRIRKTALLSGFLGRAYLASYLAFLPKSRHFCPKTGDFAYFRTYIVFLLWSSIIPTHIVQNQRTNQPVSALVITILPFQRLTRNAIGRL